MRKKERETSRAKWGNWIGDDADHGCKKAQWYSRLPQAWIPQGVKTTKGITTGDPASLLDDERNKSKNLWKAVDSPPHANDTSGLDKSNLKRDWKLACLPPHRASNLREASKSFSPKTSSSYDGFHQRHFAGMSDKALEVLAVLLDVCGLAGAWPSSLRRCHGPRHEG